MSWSDDMRCLHCDGKLPLYRKITHGQFCSTAHRKAYWQEQERLAVERLHQTHNSLLAYRPQVPVESILGPVDPVQEQRQLEPVSSELSGFVTTLLVPNPAGRPSMVVPDLGTYEMHPASVAPVCAVPEPSVRELSSSDAVPLQWNLLPHAAANCGMAAVEPRAYEMHPAPVPPVSFLPTFSLLELPSAEAVELHWDNPRPRQGLLLCAPNALALREIPIPVCRPVGQFALSAGLGTIADSVKMELAAESVSAPLAPAGSPEPLGVRVPVPLTSSVRLMAVPDAEEVQAGEEEVPRVERLFPLARFTPADISTAPIGFPQALLARIQAVLPSVVPAPLQLGMGKGSRYPIEYRRSAVQNAEPEAADFAVLPPEIVLPDHRAEVARLVTEQAIDAFVPAPIFSVLPLRFRTGRQLSKSIVPRALAIGTIPQPLQTKPILPASQLQPMKPRPSEAMPEMPAAVLKDAQAPAFPELEPQKHLWSHAAGFWKQAPRDLKILVFAIPALLVLAFHPPLPKVHFSVPAATSNSQISQNFQTVVAGQWATVRQAVFDRAAVALEEDFRSGLDSWTSRGDATAEWSFDATGFVKPGPLALYRPSMNLRDYQMQFLGLIDKKALSWVVRAANFDNYYVVKIVVLKPGPLTTLGITRYAVIDGVAENRVDTIVPVDARPDMLYRVDMHVHDSTFALSIQGQMTDSWTEPRLSKGGIGFFSARGEESRIRWVQITHQYDMLGRLCAYLAPYDISNTNGSF